jgi:hypothetical protein
MAARLGAYPAPMRLSVGAKIRLLAEIVRTYVSTRRMVSRTDLRTVLRTSREGAPEQDSLDPHTRLESFRLGAAVARVLGPPPLRSRCLMQSLVLTRVLARRGVASKLIIGVRPGEDFGAHAWVEVAGRPLLPPGGTEFERLVEL